MRIKPSLKESVYMHVHVCDVTWYHQAQDRCLWKQIVTEGMENLLTRSQPPS